MRIQHNIMAMSAYRNYTNNVSAMKKNLEKLSSGYKINRAGDDAAGLAISEKMRAQITGLETAQKNAKDGISLVQTAEGALTEVHDMLNRMVELATQSANGTYDNTTDRNQMQKEIEQLRSEINRIADSSNFNGIQLLDGSMSTLASKVGSVGLVTPGQAPEVEIKDVSASNSPLAWAASTEAVTSATIGSHPATNVMHLHSSGTPGAIGSFTVDLGGLKVQMASGTKTDIKIHVGGAAFTYTASSNGALVGASDIAAAMEDYVLTATKGGTLSFVKASTNNGVATGAMVFTITQGSGSAGKNTVTFQAVGIAKKAANGSAYTGTAIASSVAIKLTDSSKLPASWDIDHNYDVSASLTTATKAANVMGFPEVGVTKYTNTKSDGNSLFGQAVVKLDPTKIKDGMLITVGLGDDAKTYTIRTKGTLSASETSGNTIDLTKIVNASVATTGHATAIAKAIANKFAQASLGGIEIGVDSNNNLVVSEKVNANRTSAADTAVQKAMSSYTTFVNLVKFQEKKTSGEVEGTAKLEINTGKLRNGNTLKVTNNSGTVKEYKITTDKANASKAGYVYVAASAMATGLASAVKKAIAADVTTAFGTGASVSVSGKTVTVNFNVKGGSEAADIKARATMEGNKPLTLQIGDTADKFNQLDVDIKDCHTDSLGIADISVADQDKAAFAVDKIKDAINYVSDVRGTLGATQNRLDHTINNLSVMTENIQDAESTIRDTDVAEEMMAYTKNNILIQSAQAMLAQANQVPQGVLQLLQ